MDPATGAVRNGPPPGVDDNVAAARSVDEALASGQLAARRLDKAGCEQLASELRAGLLQIEAVNQVTKEWLS